MIVLSTSTSVTVLPNPQFGDTQLLESAMVVKRALDNTVRTYIKKHGQYRLKYSFRGLGHGKILELLAFIKANPTDEITLIDYNDIVWKARWAHSDTSYSLEQRSMFGYEYGDIDLEMIGVLV